MNRKEKALEFANQNWDVQITGRHIEITDSMKDYAIEKISKIERFIDKIIDVNVIMDIQKLEHRVEIILKFGGMKVTSNASCTDMYASIDKAVNKLEAQLRRYKSKIQDHHVKNHKSIDMNVNVLKLVDNDFDYDDDSDDNFQHSIISRETSPLKTLTYDDALVKMELSNDAFLIFINETDRKINVIYRRKDGNYGVIEPQY